LTGLPVPRVHDEFGYLLAADTFAHGRWTNPPHPVWQHFESFHIIQQPTYASKYPPGQGMFLAVGQVLFGQPIVGVWLSVALACAAICWMLQGWLPPRWALLGGLLAALQLVGFGSAYSGGTVGYWSQSYWGGAVAALGGALTFGALPRLIKGPRARDALLMALGLAVMANSRPFEGLVASLPAAALLFGWPLGSRRPPLAATLRCVALPLALVLLPAAGAMAYYNFRVTGHPLRMPFQVYQTTYDVTPKILCLPSNPDPTYHHAVMRDVHAGWDREVYSEQGTVYGLFVMTSVKCIKLWAFYLGPLLTIPLFTMRAIIRNPWMAFALVTCGLSLAALLLETWVFPHYAAPITGLVFVLVVQGMRHLRLWRWGARPVGQMLAAAIPALLLVWLSVSLCMGQRTDGVAWPRHRARILAELQQSGERHLVIVRYGAGHSPFDEWVYNEADIDSADVVWAREMGPDQDEKLVAYFLDRRLWLLDADAEPPVLTPWYPQTTDDGRRRVASYYDDSAQVKP
jgi:hypothetical protein